MKIVFHTPAHRKNTEGLTLMCKAYGIELETTYDFQRIKRDDYDILILNCHFVDPCEIPQRIKIIYGPQLWVFPEGGLVGPFDGRFTNRCAFNTLSKWNTVRLLETHTLRFPCIEFPFAVNLDKFSPISEEKTLDCLVYYKHRKQEELQMVLQTLQQKGLRYNQLKYGSYNEDDYLRLLRTSKFMISLDAHESQGFALEECMSCNVPLLVLDANSMYDERPDGVNSTYENRRPWSLRATSVPYWSDECGIRIVNFKQWEPALEKMLKECTNFTPRRYVERELSGEKCMRRILEYFDLTGDKVQ
jgi:hypothetical protein